MVNTVIIGAGPYGLSLAAHFRKQGIGFRIFGRLMSSWADHMPKGMMLKSEGFASNIYDPGSNLTLEKFCAERGIAYAHTGVPVKLETFTSYGAAFRDRMVPELEEKFVPGVEQRGDGYLVTLEDGETVQAQRVVLAVGITHYEYVPDSLAHLPSNLLTHSARHKEVQSFRGRSVVVIGGGSSALDLAGLLHEAGADVQLVARQQALKFHGTPTGKPRPLLTRLKQPQSGLGPGWRSLFYSDSPGIFRLLPEKFRLDIVRRALGPSGGWFIKEKVMGKVPLHLGYTLASADVQNGKVRLRLKGKDGSEREILADHVIAATGYKVNMNRLAFLSPEIRAQIKTVEGSPLLSSDFESSVPGLYFAGLSAASIFGPLMRFAYGGGFAARTIARALAKSRSRRSVPVSVPASAGSSK
jgi:thioredoxin reductase